MARVVLFTLLPFYLRAHRCVSVGHVLGSHLRPPGLFRDSFDMLGVKKETVVRGPRGNGLGCLVECCKSDYRDSNRTGEETIKTRTTGRGKMRGSNSRYSHTTPSRYHLVCFHVCAEKRTMYSLPRFRRLTPPRSKDRVQDLVALRYVVMAVKALDRVD